MADDSANNDSLSRLKRTACGLCRKRKLRCDGTRPTCATCSRLGHECVYEETRKKSGPKRGYVKALEARLAQVETQLKSKDADSSIMMADADGNLADGTNLMEAPQVGYGKQNQGGFSYNVAGDITGTAPNFGAAAPLVNPQWNAGDALDPSSAPWDMLPTGLEEPLPSQLCISELTDLYFAKIHLYVPLIHRARFLMAMAMPPNLQPPVALRYAMWTLASETSDRHASMSDIFYRRCRKYLQLDEMRGFGESIVTVAHCQAWVLISLYEFKNMYFPRAWMSCGRAVRLAQMLGLHRVDGGSTECKETLPPPKDWIEKEERRRTFWMCFWEDRCASIGTGWPMSVEEQDIHTNLPASDQSFQSGQPAPTQSLTEALQTAGADLSGFAGAILLAAMLGRNLEHMHRTTPEDNESDLNGKYWTRHRDIDNILLNLTMGLPEALRIPMGLPDPNVVFMNMCIHTSVICLHQSAMSRADKHQLTNSISTESKMRCITAALEIGSIMRSIAHLDLSTMNPFMSFCLYVAARVFIQYLRARRNDARFQSSLTFVLSAMNAMKKKNALNEAFLAQLDVEMEACGLPRPHFAPRPGSVLSQLANSSMHGKNQKAHGLASAMNPNPLENQPCRVGDFAGYTGNIVEEMADSPNAGGSSGTPENGGGANVNESRLPPPGAFDWRMPDANIGLMPDSNNLNRSTGLSPQAVMTPDSLSNSDPNNLTTTNTGTSSRHNSQGALSPPGSHVSVPFQNMRNPSNSNLPQTSSISEIPSIAHWSTSATVQDLSNVDGFVNMDLAFDLNTTSVFENSAKSPPSMDFSNDVAFLNMAYNDTSTTTIPVRSAGASNGATTDTSAETPNSWNMMSTGMTPNFNDIPGSGMTPNFNDLTNGPEWDNLMENLADWDPSTAGEMLLP